MNPRWPILILLIPLACGESTSDLDARVGPTPDAAIATDAGTSSSDAGTSSSDAGPPQCAALEMWDGTACVDLDECATDNGGCGAPESFVCENQDRAAPICRYDSAADFVSLTAGVRIIDSEGALPSSLVIHGDTAFGVVFDESERPFIAAARAGAGRVVVFGHEAHLGGLLDNESDLDQLAANAIEWTTSADAPVVGAIDGFGDFLRFAEGLGYDIDRITIDELDAVDLLVVPASGDRSESDWALIRAWVEGGGGLLVAGQAWYWSLSNEDTATAYPANVLLNPLGITYTPYSHVTAELDTVSQSPPGPLRHAKDALRALREHVEATAALPIEEQRLAVATVSLAVDVLPVGAFSEYFERAIAFERVIGPVVIAEDTPLVRADLPLEALAVVIATKMSLDAPVDQVEAHLMAEIFPGAVPPEAPRIDVTRRIDASHVGLSRKYAYANARAAAMRSTGVYAAPGDTITVRIPAEAIAEGLGVRIGAHTDTLWNKDEWSRYPRMAQNTTLRAEETQVASGLGGPIYVTVPAGTSLGPIDVTVEGGVEMAYYELGVSDPASWATSRLAPAPWAEFATSKLIITVPAAAAAAIDDPQPLLQLWDRVLDADATLSNFSTDRLRAERFVFDRQISAGWMHSGYPIMAHLASVQEAIDVTRLSTEGSWGLFHELGHNHQWRDWVLPGTTEANVNLFSVYAMETVVGRDRGLAHSALAPASRSARIDSYLATGPDFSQWSVWTALESYLQIQETFGWAPFQAAFLEYRGLSSAEAPFDDAARIDMWMVSMSRATGRDLSGFFLAWGHPLSATAIADVSGLPAWTDHPLAGR